MVLNLPRLPLIEAIVTENFKPTAYLQKIWGILCSTLEGNNLQIQSALDAITQQQSQINQQLVQILAVQSVANSAASTASQANSSANPTSPQNQHATQTQIVSSTSFGDIVTVSFSSAVAASSVTISGSGPTGGAQVGGTSGHNGSVQMKRNGVVVAGPVAYALDADGTLMFGGFTDLGSDPGTGTITYDLQARRVSGNNANVSFLLDVTRNP